MQVPIPPESTNPTSSNTWMLSIPAGHKDHNHEMHPDPFSFVQHHKRDPDRSSALMHGAGLRKSGMPFFVIQITTYSLSYILIGTTYRQALATMKVHGYSLEQKQYYNLIRNKSKPSDEEKIEIAMAHLDLQGFHASFAERYMVENNVRQR